MALTAEPMAVDVMPRPDRPPRRSWSESARWGSRNAMLIAAILGGAALFAAWLLERAGTGDSTCLALLAVSFALCGSFAAARAGASLKRLQLDTNVLMVVGAILAAFVGQPLEGALLLFLFTLSSALEILATGRAEQAVHSLGQKFPTEAIVERDGRRVPVRVADVAVGERLVVRPGDRVACDGEVIEGGSHVDESAITGEFLPRAKGVGEPVYAGSLNGERALVVRVTRRASESTLARVTELVQAARGRKTHLEALIDRIGRVYGPTMFVLAGVIFVVALTLYREPWSAALYRAIALLIVASPCALMLATPVPILCAIAHAARQGIVSKGGAYFEALARARTLFLDKTGTLTSGKIRVAGITPLGAATEGDVLALAAALERDSTHPLAAAVLTAARQGDIRLSPVADVKNVAGLGMTGRRAADKAEIRLGRAEWAGELVPGDLREALAAVVRDAEQRGRTPVVLAGGGIAGVLAFEDTLRPGAEGLVTALRDAGLRRVELLTGDRRGVAEAMGRRVGLDACHAELLPADKLALVEAASHRDHGVIMVGDGVNDAPALARADVGIAMGGIGSHTALESADFVLLHDRVEMLPYLIRHAHFARRITAQNVAIALGVIAVLALWVCVTAHPILSLGVIGHEGSTLVVVLNGLRVLTGPKSTGAG